MKKALLTLTMVFLYLPGYILAADNQDLFSTISKLLQRETHNTENGFDLKIPKNVAETTGFKKVLLNLNDTDKFTGKTFKQLIDGDEQTQKHGILSLVFTKNKYYNSWNTHIYHSDLLSDHCFLHEKSYNVPGSRISDPFNIHEILKYEVTIYAYKKEAKYIIWPTDGAYSEYVD